MFEIGVMLIGIILIVVNLKAKILGVNMLSDIILSVIVVNVILRTLFTLNFIMLSVTPLKGGGGMLAHSPPPHILGKTARGH